MLTDKLMIKGGIRCTEFIPNETQQQLVKVNVSHLTVGEADIAPSSTVRNLGSWFDSRLSMVHHITKTCSSAFYIYITFAE